jgi:hypothetical protein
MNQSSGQKCSVTGRQILGRIVLGIMHHGHLNLLTTYDCIRRDSIITCDRVLIRRVLGGMIGFIDTSFTQLGTIGNYSAIADLHTL